MEDTGDRIWRLEGMVNKIFELRNTALSLHGLNTAVTIVTSNLAELHRNGVLIKTCYSLTESEV